MVEVVLEVVDSVGIVVFVWIRPGPDVVMFMGEVADMCPREVLAAIVVELTIGASVVRGESVVKMLIVVFSVGLMSTVTV